MANIMTRALGAAGRVELRRMFKAIMTALILARFILQRSWAPHRWLERARRARRPSLERAGAPSKTLTPFLGNHNNAESMTRLYRKRSWQAPGRAGSIPETELVVWTVSVITLGVTVSSQLRLCVTVCLINSDRVW